MQGVLKEDRRPGKFALLIHTNTVYQDSEKKLQQHVA